MNGNKPSALDILACRKLVELYFGVPMVASVIESFVAIGTGTVIDILKQDPRRIRYELAISCNAVGPDDVLIGTPQAFAAGTMADYFLQANSTLIIDRNFLTDLDAVTLPLQAAGDTGNIVISIRETFLTPSAIDEIPDV